MMHQPSGALIEESGLMEINSEGKGKGHGNSGSIYLMKKLRDKYERKMYRIWLADDEGIMLELLKALLETEYGMARDPSKSQQSCRCVRCVHPPEICFMDIQMPGISESRQSGKFRKFNSL